MIEIITSYRCPLCQSVYGTASEAMGCEAIGFHPRLKVGDIVTEGGRYGWFNGDERWVYKKVMDKEHLEKYPSLPRHFVHWFFYVVTAVTIAKENYGPRHAPHYHLVTRAMKTMPYLPYGRKKPTKSRPVSGWTVDETHLYMDLVEPEEVPTIVAKQAKRFIGHVSRNLI